MRTPPDQPIQPSSSAPSQKKAHQAAKRNRPAGMFVGVTPPVFRPLLISSPSTANGPL